MALIKAMPSQAVISGLRGVLDFYEYCNLVIVRSWPRMRIKERAPGVVAAQSGLAYASNMYSDLPAHVVQSWEFLADQSNLTARDWLIRAYLGGTLTAPGQPPM